MRRKNWELKGIFWIITLLFVGFLAAPILLLLGKSLVGEGGFTWEFYASVVTREGFLTALGNSFAVAAASAMAATVIAFLMAYAVHYTGLPRWLNRYDLPFSFTMSLVVRRSESAALGLPLLLK